MPSGPTGLSSGSSHSSRATYGGVSPHKPHYCASPGCTRRGEREYSPGTKLHYCGSPGCTRRGQPESAKPVEDYRVRFDRDAAKSKLTPVKDRTVVVEPDAFQFTVLETAVKGDFVLARILYHGCTNFEGQKILLMKKKDKEIQALDSLDPHFLQKDENGLIARFVPNHEGWTLGLRLLNSLG